MVEEGREGKRSKARKRKRKDSVPSGAELREKHAWLGGGNRQSWFATRYFSGKGRWASVLFLQLVFTCPKLRIDAEFEFEVSCLGKVESKKK